MMPAMAVTPHPFSLGAEENPYPVKEQEQDRTPAAVQQHLSGQELLLCCTRGMRHQCIGTTTQDDHHAIAARPSCHVECPYPSVSYSTALLQSAVPLNRSRLQGLHYSFDCEVHHNA